MTAFKALTVNIAAILVSNFENMFPEYCIYMLCNIFQIVQLVYGADVCENEFTAQNQCIVEQIRQTYIELSYDQLDDIERQLIGCFKQYSNEINSLFQIYVHIQQLIKAVLNFQIIQIQSELNTISKC